MYVQNTFGFVTQTQLPAWASVNAPLDRAKVSRDQGKNAQGRDVYIWELIPKSESFDAWTKLYAVYVERPLKPNVEGYAGGEIKRYDRACTSSYVQIFEEVTPDAALFVVFCGAYRNDPETGEVVLYHMQMRGDVLVKHYYHQRVPAYEATAEGLTAGLPLPEQDIVEMYRTVAQLRLGDPE
ncbi:hypothetical protein [Primorskyibacter sp. S187A]|uniref:hypothetical protein n=1 Tax=Primorskyibacter sp. S187A TaxID=3415130 RepID=UPI003C7DD808